ncbi:outer membrane beta-barrel protein [Termitidicoccus mucosus]|uniref:TonB-dependent receptor plug domain-containing protein n=1 Tax=Termitidicoccus mucosus TaxID=1184151 RepID=A0A178IBF5_9BACT|nr:hypothetical protein AW736_23500 [Opitutaceae bacterium TSB47]
MWLASVTLSLADASAQTSAPTGSVTGHVYDASIDQFVRNAEISVEGTSIAVASEDGGYYRLDNLPAGPSTLILKYSGRQTRTFTVNVVPGGATPFEMELGAAIGPPAGKNDDVILLEKFTVTGEREGNAKAYMEQKASMNMKNVVASDVFGEIADGNVAEFLKYMPGLTTNDSDEARDVSIRGLNSKYGGLTMDGNRLASGSGEVGSFSFDQISLTSIDSIEVNKVLTAELDGDAPAGIINVRTKSPLDQKRMHLNWAMTLSGNSYDISLDKKPGFGDQSIRRVRPAGSFSYSDNFLGRKLGISLSASRSDYVAHQEILRQYYNYGTTGLGTPYVNDMRIYDTDKRYIRDALDFGVDFQATRALRFQLRMTYASINTESHQYVSRFYASASAPEASATYMRSTDGGGQLQLGNGGSRVKEGATFAIMPSFTYKKSNLTIDGRFGYSRSYTDDADLEHGYFQYAMVNMTGVTVGASRADTDSTAWNIVVDRDISDPANFASYQNRALDTHDEQEMYTSALNLKWIIPWSVPAFIKTGVAYRATVRRKEDNSAYYSYLGPDRISGTPDDSYAGWVSSKSFTNHYGINIYDTNGTLMDIKLPSRTQLATIFREHSPDSADPWFTGDKNDEFETWFLNRVNYWEEIPAAYVMGNAKFGRLQLQAGVRWEHTGQHINLLPDPYADEEMTAMGLPITPKDEAYLQAKYKGGRRAWKEIEYDDLFASASARWIFTQNLFLRAGFAQAIHRPSVTQLQDFSQITEDALDDEDLTSININLQPERSNNYSIEIEYYFEPSGKLSASVFCNDIKDVIYKRSYVLFDENNNPKYRSKWENGERLTMRGFELEYSQAYTFLPGFLRYTGLFANYTHVFFDKDNMEKEKLSAGTVPQNASAGIWFDNRKLSVRLKSVWRDETFYQASQYPKDGPADYYYNVLRREPSIRFDLDMEYRFKFDSLSLSFFVTGRNILNESRRTYSNVKGRLYEESLLGAMWTAGIKGAF